MTQTHFLAAFLYRNFSLYILETNALKESHCKAGLKYKWQKQSTWCVCDSKPVLCSSHPKPSKLLKGHERSHLSMWWEMNPALLWTACGWSTSRHLTQAGPPPRPGASALGPVGGPQTCRSIWHGHRLLTLTKVYSESPSSGRHCADAVAGGRAMSFNLLTSICQFGSFLADRCRRACLVKWSLLMNRRSHMGQANFFSPVCVRRCLDSSSERANLLSQPFQLQLKGFSPVCVLTWAFRWELLK